MNTTKTAKEIYDFMVERLAEGVSISEENKKDMVEKIEFKLYDLTEN
jgi:hypothetical protein